MKSTVRTALCGMLTALAVTFMLIEPLLPVLLYCCPVLSGICIALVCEEFGKAYGTGVYIASSLLSLILVADKEAVVVLVLLTGVFPIIKHMLGNVSFAAALAVKLIYINAACIAYFFVCIKLFGIPSDSFGAVPLLLLPAGNIIMLTYDAAIGRVCRLYKTKFRNRIMKGKW